KDQEHRSDGLEQRNEPGVEQRCGDVDLPEEPREAGRVLQLVPPVHEEGDSQRQPQDELTNGGVRCEQAVRHGALHWLVTEMALLPNCSNLEGRSARPAGNPRSLDSRFPGTRWERPV